MSSVFCPQCQLPVTGEEARSGTCPSCGSSLATPTTDPSPAPPAAPSRSLGFGTAILLLGAALLVFLAGSSAGFFLYPQIYPPPDRPVEPANGLAQEVQAPEPLGPKKEVNKPEDKKPIPDREKVKPVVPPSTDEKTDKALARIKELEATSEQLREEAANLKKLAADAKAREDTATSLLAVTREEAARQKQATNQALAEINALRLAEADVKAQRDRVQAALNNAERAYQDAQKAIATLQNQRSSDPKSQQLEARRYYAQLALVQRLLPAKPNEATQFLEDCPSDLRGWEWHYLRQLTKANHLTLSGHEGRVLAIAFSPDGQRLVSAGEDKSVRQWDVATGKQLGVLDHHKERVTQVAYSPDGKRIASASADKTIRIWDTATNEELLRLNHGAAVTSISFSLDGRLLLAASEDRALKVWAVATGIEVLKIQGHPEVVRHTAYSPDGKCLATVGDEQVVRIYNATTGGEISSFRPGGNIRDLAFSPDSRRIVTASDDRVIHVRDVTNGQEVFALRGHNGPVRGVVFSPDGKRIISAAEDNSVKIWDAMTGLELLSLPSSANCFGVAFSGDGRHLAAACADNKIRLWTTPADKR